MLTEAKLYPSQKTNAVVIIGRFQPPTKGHYKIIDLAKKYARTHKELLLCPSPILVIIDGEKSSKDKKINPLSVDERRYFIQNSGKANGVIILDAKNAVDAFNQVRKAGYEPKVIGAGSDRIDGYLKILDEMFKDEFDKKIKHFTLDGLEEREEKDIDGTLKASGKIALTKVSGSLARRAAELNYFDEFVDITGLSKNIPAAKKMFKLVRYAVGAQE